MAGRTLYDKIWQSHLVKEFETNQCLLYIDLHLINEVTSPQAFDGLRASNRGVRRPDLCLAVADHNVPTENQHLGLIAVSESDANLQLAFLEQNTREFGIEFFPMGDRFNGIVHVVGPELGCTLPGMTIVCGDSHTSTHGAFGALAQGIGTSEAEHVLATQTLRQFKSKNMRVRFTGAPRPGITAKDFALQLIRQIGTAGATGYVIEYCGAAVESLSMEGRMTLCNMTIEAGARAGLIAPDEVTFNYLADKPRAPKGEEWSLALADWKQLYSDQDAIFDKDIEIDVSAISPLITWGVSPEDVISIDEVVPDPNLEPDLDRRKYVIHALNYMGLVPGSTLKGLVLDRVFIGSCTNSRIEDLRVVAEIVTGRQVAKHTRAMVVPGSWAVKRMAEAEGIHTTLIEAGFEWREPGCSMCLGMNPDRLGPGERCASTSNRNFEGRQGRGGRTHLVSPAMAAAAAISGCLVDLRDTAEYR